MKFVQQSQAAISASLGTHLSSMPEVLKKQIASQLGEKLVSAEAEEFNFVFSILSQTTMFAPACGYQHFVTLLTSDLSGLSQTIRLLLHYEILEDMNLQNIQPIFILLLAQSDLESLNQAIIRIAQDPHQLFKTSFASMILKALIQHATPNGVAFAITVLTNYDLLNEDNIDSIAKYSRPMLLAKKLSELFELPRVRHLLQEIISGAIASKSLVDFCEKIKNMHENDQLDVHSIRSADDLCSLAKDLSIFGKNAPSPHPFFSTSSTGISPVSSADSSTTERKPGSLADLLSLCRQ